MKISINKKINKDSQQKIGKMLEEYNSTYVSQKKESSSTPIEIILRNDADKIIGGLYGRTIWGNMEIKTCVIHQAKRKQGFGKILIQSAEKEARKRKCNQITLDTFSFQAPGFYENLGFEKIGVETNFPIGYEKYYYRKILK